ncbi:MAG: heat-inducible transcriptional repressor HrcA [Actinomycetota bacterium]|nr:heat-inducible transcriptional repressor HrcA [Actinomycetota bacterium]
MPPRHRDLAPRQREILRRVVEEYVATGQPVGSKNLVERGRMNVSPSTVRSELAELELRGLLSHPHTSAGRVPTEEGYRAYADELLDRLEPRPGGFPLEFEGASELEVALQAATERLSELTRLLALVSAPPLQATTLRHVEVLLLQPQVVMVVLITAAGSVSKRISSFDSPVDPGLANWAREYLNERVSGLRLGTHLLRQRFEDPELSQREREFLAVLRPAFTDLLAEEQRLFVGGAAGLLGDVRAEEVAAYRRVLELLERRPVLLAILHHAVDPARPFIRVGRELEVPALEQLALVGAAYGLLNRTLGAVSLLGPVRMDYEKAVRSVRAAARELSRVAEEVYADE